MKGLIAFAHLNISFLSEKRGSYQVVSNYFDEIEIIYAVRRQDRLLASGFNQGVKDSQSHIKFGLVI